MKRSLCVHNRVARFTIVAALAAVILPAAAIPAAAGVEVELEFRNVPDTSAKYSERQSLNLDDDMAQVTENGEKRAVEVTAEQATELARMIEKRVQAFRFEKGTHVPPPRIEVILEFDGRDREIEVTEIYPAGKVPAEYVEIQKRYFKKSFE